MRKKKYILGLIVLILFFYNCKKEVNITNSPTNIIENCSNTENTDTVYTNSHYLASEKTNEGGLVILEKIGQLYSIIKTDNNGNYQWKKDFTEITGNYTGLTTTDDGIYITSNIDINNFSYYDTTYVGANGFFVPYGSMVNCNPNYNYIDTCVYATQNIVEGITYLSKIDYDGNFVYTKQFEGNTINNNENKGFVQSLNNNEIVLITFDYYGSIPYELVWDTLNNRIDTVKYETDNNTIHIYRLNSSGNIIWEKEINNIQTPIFTIGSYPFGVSNYYVLSNNSHIVVNLYSYLIIYDINGEVVATLNEDRKCEYKIGYTLLLDDNIIFSQRKIPNGYFSTKTDLNGNILDDNFQIEIYNSKQFDGNSFIGYNSDEGRVFVSDINNNIINEKYIESVLVVENILPACDNSFYTIKSGYIDDGSATGGNNYYYVINKEVFE